MEEVRRPKSEVTQTRMTTLPK